MGTDGTAASTQLPPHLKRENEEDKQRTTILIVIGLGLTFASIFGGTILLAVLGPNHPKHEAISTGIFWSFMSTMLVTCWIGQGFDSRQSARYRKTRRPPPSPEPVPDRIVD